MSTIHNPVNFEPTDYSVVAYLDNQPPKPPHAGYALVNAEAFNRMMAEWRADVEAWEARWKALDVDGSKHRCIHCGNGNVRYITVCRHAPSGRNVCFGTDCTERLNLPGADAFKAKFIRTQVNTYALHLEKLAKQAALCEAYPGLADALQVKNNNFIADIRAKFEQYGELSDRQCEAVIAAAQREKEYQAKREAERANRGPVPTGERITFSGVLVSRKDQESQFGLQHKCLIKLDNGSAIWMTEPSAMWDANVTKGDSVTIRATVEASKDDASFGFAKRPHFISTVPAVKPAAPRNNAGEGA